MAETKDTGEKAVKFGKIQDVSLKTIEKAPKDTQQKYCYLIKRRIPENSGSRCSQQQYQR